MRDAGTPEPALSYTDEARQERARERLSLVDKLVSLRGKRVLEVGCGYGDITRLLAQEYACQAVGVDVQRHESWHGLKSVKNLIVEVADISAPHELWVENSFDVIISFTVWEHIRHPWSALQTCQRILKPNGQMYMHAYLNGSSRASHLYNYTADAWPHLLYSPDEIKQRYELSELDWYFWCNKLTYQQYLFYFRRLGFYITYEHLLQYGFNEQAYKEHEMLLGLYPRFDLMTDGFQIVLEFNQAHPKKAVDDPVYFLRAR